MGKYNFQPGDHIYEWTLIQRIPDTPNLSPICRNRWRVECSCGRRETLPQYYFTRVDPKKHCGHLRKSNKTKYPRVYSIWYMMRRRCNDPSHIAYKYYGGRGVKVCPEWDNDTDGFDNFLGHMGPPPSPSHTLDRFPDNDGTTGYRPGNVRWATPTEQRANQRNPSKTS